MTKGLAVHNDKKVDSVRGSHRVFMHNSTDYGINPEITVRISAAGYRNISHEGEPAGSLLMLLPLTGWYVEKKSFYQEINMESVEKASKLYQDVLLTRDGVCSVVEWLHNFFR